MVGVGAGPHADNIAMTKTEIRDINFLFIFSPFLISLRALCVKQSKNLRQIANSALSGTACEGRRAFGTNVRPV